MPFTAGMKLATKLIPTVAAKNVMAAMTLKNTLSVRATISVGLMMASPYTTAAPAVVSRAKAENKIIFNGKPMRLPLTMACLSLAKREKSLKLIITAEK